MYPNPVIELFKKKDGTYFLSVNLYEIFILIGIVACLVLAYFLAKHRKMDKKVFGGYIDVAIVSIILGFFGAILFQGIYNLIDTGSFGTGMTFLGGLITAAGVFLLATFLILPKSYRKDFPQIAEIAAPCIALAHGFGRIGCFFGGCCYGVHTDSWIGIHFPDVGKVIPTNLIEAIFLFILAGALIFLVIKDIKLAFIAYLFAYGIFRFTIEFWRDKTDLGVLIPGLNPSQWWCILMVIAAGVLLYLKLKNKKTKNNIEEDTKNDHVNSRA